MNDISILIPAFNEKEHIKKTLQSIRDVPNIKEIIVVDDGSVDETGKIAVSQGAKVIRLEKNVGKGGAITKAFPYLNGNYILLIDADLEDSAKLTYNLIQPVLMNTADISIAVFPKKNCGNGFGIAKRTARWGIWLLTGTYLNMPLSGQRFMKKETLETLLPLAAGFGVEVAMNIDALRKGYRLVEVETDLKHSPPGRNLKGFMHRGRQFYQICWVIGAYLWK